MWALATSLCFPYLVMKIFLARVYPLLFGEQGWRSGENAHLPPMWSRFKSQHRCHMWVEFVVGSLPCSETFFSGYSGFPISSKTNTSKCQFDQESGRRRTTLWMCYLQIIIICCWPIHPWTTCNRPCRSTSFLPFVTSSVLTVKDNFVR